MPQIVLTKDINPAKGWVTGSVQQWERATIKQISAGEGNDDWYEPEASLSQSINRQAARAKTKRGPGRPRGSKNKVVEHA